jgi:hypothetical protein
MAIIVDIVIVWSLVNAVSACTLWLLIRGEVRQWKAHTDSDAGAAFTTTPRGRRRLTSRHGARPGAHRRRRQGV